MLRPAAAPRGTFSEARLLGSRAVQGAHGWAEAAGGQQKTRLQRAEACFCPALEALLVPGVLWHKVLSIPPSQSTLYRRKIKARADRGEQEAHEGSELRDFLSLTVPGRSHALGVL